MIQENQGFAAVVGGVIAKSGYETRGTSHISLMFVDKTHHKKGIARQMFNVVIEELAKNPTVTQITVNSSPYAVEVDGAFL